MNRIALFATAALLSLPLAAHAAPELINNGNFEQTNTTATNGNFQLTAGGTYGTIANWYTSNSPTNSNPYNILYRTNPVGQTPNNADTAITTSSANSPTGSSGGAWGQYSSNQSTASSSNEKLVSSFNRTSASGGNFMALDGDSGVNGYLNQDVTGLTVGALYTLTFNWAVSELASVSPAATLTEYLKVSFGGTTKQTDTVAISSQGFSNWMKATMSFVATSSSQTLSFLSIGTPNGAPPMALLDGVSLTAAPEPASLALVGAGIAGLALVRRRAGKASKTA